MVDYKQDILESLTDGVWLMSEDGKTVNISRGFWSRLGLDLSTEEMPVDRLEEYVFDGDMQLFRFLLNSDSDFQERSSSIVRFIHNDGGWVWFELKLKNLTSHGGRRAFLFFDISSTKEREQIYNEFDSINSTGGYYLNMEDMQIFWTPSMYKIHGLEKGATPTVENAINFYKEGESRERIEILFNDSVINGTEFDAEFEFIDASGVEKWVRSRGKPLMKDGKCKMVYGTIQDITKDKLKELAVDTSRRRFEEVFNSTYQFCGIIDEDGTLIEANETALSFAGITPQEIEGKKFWEIHWWQNSAENRKSLELAIKLAAKGEFVRYNTKVWDKDCNEVTIDFSLKPMKNGGNSSNHIIAEGRVIQDIIDAQKSLEAMVRKITHQNETLRNFAHIVSHNLRSHASNIGLLTSIMESGVDKPLDAKVHGMLELASARLTETISHVSDVVVIHTSEGETPEVVNLLTSVNDAVATIGAIIKSAGASIKIEVSDEINIKGVKAYIDSIFLNLITNGVKYREKSRSCLLTIKATESNANVVLEFEDNGQGIDLEKHGAKLFGMYKTFHGNEDAEGIGLFITKNQIESMGGKIEVESQLGAGTKFIIKFLAA